MAVCAALMQVIREATVLLDRMESQSGGGKLL